MILPMHQACDAWKLDKELPEGRAMSFPHESWCPAEHLAHSTRLTKYLWNCQQNNEQNNHVENHCCWQLTSLLTRLYSRPLPQHRMMVKVPYNPEGCWHQPPEQVPAGNISSAHSQENLGPCGSPVVRLNSRLTKFQSKFQTNTYA